VLRDIKMFQTCQDTTSEEHTAGSKSQRAYEVSETVVQIVPMISNNMRCRHGAGTAIRRAGTCARGGSATAGPSSLASRSQALVLRTSKVTGVAWAPAEKV
jgi:hypothetical protein